MNNIDRFAITQIGMLNISMIIIIGSITNKTHTPEQWHVVVGQMFVLGCAIWIIWCFIITFFHKSTIKEE